MLSYVYACHMNVIHIDAVEVRQYTYLSYKEVSKIISHAMTQKEQNIPLKQFAYANMERGSLFLHVGK